jgi:hypothetical protein
MAASEKGPPLALRAPRRFRLALCSIAVASATCVGIAGSAGAQPTTTSSVVVSPEPGSQTAMPQTQISFLGIAPSAIGTVTVTGSVSGPHTGTLEPYSTGTGASFVPSTPFTAGETVDVHTSLDIVGTTSGDFSFTVVTPATTADAATGPGPVQSLSGASRFLSAPTLRPPHFAISGSGASLGADDLLLAPKGTVGQTGPMITTANGRLLYFDPISNLDTMNVNVQHYDGRPVLTWWEGSEVDGHGEGVDYIMSDTYKLVKTVSAGNGLSADLHDFVISAQNTAFITAYEPLYWNLSAEGGSATGTVWDGVIQEIDIPTGLVMYEWHALDHIAVSASEFRAPKVAASHPFDWFHINGVEPLPGGTFLISSRCTSALYDISINGGGQINWTLGGKNTSFQIGAGANFNYEHNGALHGTDIVTVFDNEAAPTPSRALVLQVNFQSKTVSLVHAYSHTPQLRDYTLGNVDLLANGDVLVSWGTSTQFSLYSPSGATLMNVTMPGNDNTYRTEAAPWSATPSTPPAVYADNQAGGTLVAASWNGATGVSQWRILAGTSPRTLKSVATIASTSFESTDQIPTARYVEVEALGSAGRILGHSRAVRVR